MKQGHYLTSIVNPPVQRGCPMMNFGMEADDTSPVIRDKVYETICNVQQGMMDILEKGIEDGEFKSNWNYKEFAMKAYAMIEGGILVARVSQDISQMKMLMDILKREINDQAAEV
jgi:TetR/AcrR family transcriptional repressor of nem operon